MGYTDCKRISAVPGLKAAWAGQNGGEDYELIFTMAPADFQMLQQHCPYITRIGHVENGEGKVLLRHDGVQTVLPKTGWNHFQ